MCEKVEEDLFGGVVLALQYVSAGLNETGDENKDVYQMKADSVCPQSISEPLQ